MIQRFVIGKPFPTESVVLDLPAETGPVPYLTPDGDGWQYVMQEKDIVYGLGEMPRGLNKRGWHYETNNTDESEHGENRLSYYAAHNFLLISPADGSGCIGIFVDFPGKVSYDIGGVISGVVVDDDDFVAVVRVVEVEQGADGAPDDDALVVRRHHYRHERVLVNRHMPVRFAALMVIQESADGQKDVNRHQRPDADHRNQHQIISRRHADSPPPARLSRAYGCPAAAAASSAGK